MCCDIHHTLSRSVQFFLLTIAFFSNMYGMVVCFTISFSLHNTHCQKSYKITFLASINASSSVADYYVGKLEG